MSEKNKIPFNLKEIRFLLDLRVIAILRLTERDSLEVKIDFGNNRTLSGHFSEFLKYYFGS